MTDWDKIAEEKSAKPATWGQVNKMAYEFAIQKNCKFHYKQVRGHFATYFGLTEDSKPKQKQYLVAHKLVKLALAKKPLPKKHETAILKYLESLQDTVV